MEDLLGRLESLEKVGATGKSNVLPEKVITQQGLGLRARPDISRVAKNLLQKQQLPGAQSSATVTRRRKDGTKQAQGPARRSQEEWTTAPQLGWAPNSTGSAFT